MTERSALITGAGSGVGRAVALAMAEDGYAVGLVGRTPEPLQATAAAVIAAGGVAYVATADVSDETSIADAVQRTLTVFGKLSVVVCAAGVGYYGPVETYDLADWQRTLATNLTGVFLTCRAVLPSMRAAGEGTIIAIGSGAGKQGYANLAAYSASKFGLLGFMQSLAAEVGSDGIKVSTIVPGSIMTGFGGTPLEVRERQRAEGKSFLEPEDVAEAVCYLLNQSPRAWTQEMNLWPFAGRR